MGRHGIRVGAPARAARVGALTVVWLFGLLVGFFALLSLAASYSCGPNSRGLACRPAGVALGVGLVLAVIAVVTAVTVLAHDPTRHRRLAGAVLAGALALAGCYLAAHALTATA